MRRYGLRDEATRVAYALLEAAVAFERRLPECFAGFERDETGLTVEYPGALRPQSWSAAAPFFCIRTFLGLDVVRGKLRTRRALPPEIALLKLSSVAVRGRKVDA
jgi:glycogen debranching enzyme